MQVTILLHGRTSTASIAKSHKIRWKEKIQANAIWGHLAHQAPLINPPSFSDMPVFPTAATGTTSRPISKLCQLFLESTHFCPLWLLPAMPKLSSSTRLMGYPAFDLGFSLPFCTQGNNPLQAPIRHIIPVFKTHWSLYAQSLNCLRLSVTPWTVARQAPLSMGSSRQEYWSGLPFPPSAKVLTRA